MYLVSPSCGEGVGGVDTPKFPYRMSIYNQLYSMFTESFRNQTFLSKTLMANQVAPL